MTQQRRDNHSTEFGLWLRQQKDIDSKLGFTATNLDYIWRNYKSGKWMLIEEKRKGKDAPFYQKQMFAVLHKAALNDPNYIGFYFIQFENTSPDDGKIWINGKEATKELLTKLLRFEWIKQR